MNRCAHRILRALATGGRKPNVLRGLAFAQIDFEQAIGQLFLSGQVCWNGRAKARVLTLKARPA